MYIHRHGQMRMSLEARKSGRQQEELKRRTGRMWSRWMGKSDGTVAGKASAP